MSDSVLKLSIAITVGRNLTIFSPVLGESLTKKDYLPKHDDILKEADEDKDDASTHPNIQGRNIAHSGCVLPD